MTFITHGSVVHHFILLLLMTGMVSERAVVFEQAIGEDDLETLEGYSNVVTYYLPEYVEI